MRAIKSERILSASVEYAKRLFGKINARPAEAKNVYSELKDMFPEYHIVIIPSPAGYRVEFIIQGRYKSITQITLSRAIQYCLYYIISDLDGEDTEGDPIINCLKMFRLKAIDRGYDSPINIEDMIAVFEQISKYRDQNDVMVNFVVGTHAPRDKGSYFKKSETPKLNIESVEDIPDFVKINRVPFRFDRESGKFTRHEQNWEVGYQLKDKGVFSFCPKYSRFHDAAVMPSTRDQYINSMEEAIVPHDVKKEFD